MVETQGLTTTQVEAVIDCFDFIRNGYREIVSYCSNEIWLIKLRHTTNKKCLRIYIHPHSYYVSDGKDVRKFVEHKDDGWRYDIEIDSEVRVTKKKRCLGER